MHRKASVCAALACAVVTLAGAAHARPPPDPGVDVRRKEDVGRPDIRFGDDVMGAIANDPWARSSRASTRRVATT